MSTRVVQITNIAPQATKDQMQNLFGIIGKIDEIRLYPTVRDVTCPVTSRVCYVKFFESSCVAVAQHLTNTVFIDRALIVGPVSTGSIPDEFKALEIINNGSGVPGLPADDTQLPPEVVNRVEGTHPFQMIKTADPKLEEYDLPEYPPLPITFDAKKIEEIRRTIIVIDVPADWEIHKILEHFASAGEVKYARFAEKSRQKHVMIEYCEQKSVINALKMQGTEFMGEKLNIYHSMQAIIKPEAKSNEAAQREIEEAMSIVKETQSMISAALDPVINILSSKEKSVSSHRRTRSKSRSSRDRTRSRSRSRRSKSRKRSRRSRTRSRSRKRRSRSRSKRRSVSRSRSKRSRSRSKRPRSRDRERERRKRTRSRERRRSRSPTRERERERRRSRSRSHERRDRVERDRRDRERVDRERGDRERERRRTRSPQTSKTSSRKASRKEEKRSRKSREKSRSRSRDRRHAAKESSSRRERDRRNNDDDRDEKESKDRRRDKEERRNDRSRSKESSRKIKRISEEKPSQRDYDAEERIGTEDSKRDDSSDDASKSDNMDIANSP